MLLFRPPSATIRRTVLLFAGIVAGLVAGTLFLFGAYTILTSLVSL